MDTSKPPAEAMDLNLPMGRPKGGTGSMLHLVIRALSTASLLFDIEQPLFVDKPNVPVDVFFIV